MEKLQVKYLETERELNKFLLTLSIGVNSSLPRLHNIYYIPKAEGNGTSNVMSIDSTIIAAVQYIVEVE